MRKVALFLILALCIFACKRKKTEEKIQYSEEMAKVVSTVTNGNISANDIIAIKFVEEVISKDEIGKEIDIDIFSISPNIKGKAYWQDSYTLVLEPEEQLDFFETFKGSLNLSEIHEKFKDQNLHPLEFSFTVKGREIKNFKGELLLKNRNNPKVLKYSGSITIDEHIDIAILEEALKVKKGSKEIGVKITSESSKNVYHFVTEDLARENSTNTYTLNINKGKLGIRDDFVKTFEVSPLEKMKVVNIEKEEKERNPKVRLYFSDDFDLEQDLTGLVKTEPQTNVKLTKVGSSIIVDGKFLFGESYKISVAKGIKSRWGTVSDEEYVKTVKFANIQPQVEFASDGIFLPKGNQFKLQFYTSNLRRVHIEVKKVYDNSLSEFMQTEQLNSSTDRKAAFSRKYINRVGVIVHNETFEIGEEKNSWLLNEIDLSKLVELDGRGLYLIRLNFNHRDMLVPVTKTNLTYIEETGQIYKPVFFSNIGITAKRFEDGYRVYTTNLTTAEPLPEVKVSLMKMYGGVETNDYTNTNGMATLNTNRFYNYYIMAEKWGQRSVIKFSDMEWNISGFEIGGTDEYKPNTKAYIYTERGVYRPGDEINLSIIARFANKTYPNNHPLTVKLYNPEGKEVYEITNRDNNDGFYNFKIQTKESDPTGNWRALFKVGNKRFNHPIKIETVVPYRLKVRIEPEQEFIDFDKESFSIELLSTYLFGNPAAGLKAEVEAEIYNRKKTFPKYTDFTFSNPCVDFQTITQKIFSGILSEEGTKNIIWNLPNVSNAPSALGVRITSKVYEKGGRPNENVSFIPYEPYNAYVGLQAPKHHYIPAGTTLKVPTILVDASGKAVTGKQLTYRIFRNSEHWWWHYDRNNKLRFKSDRNTTLIKEGKVSTGSTHSIVKFLPIHHGNYLVEVTDEEGSGHSSGFFVSAYRYGSSDGQDKNAGTLVLSSDKDKYFTGETAKIQFPSPKEGMALVTVEKENEIIYEKWHNTNGKENMEVGIPITDAMTPNAYVAVSLIQPHEQTVNDRPIRMFGILPLAVEQKSSRHTINIKTANQFRPKKPFEIELQTSDQKPTQYTIAVVDEGLLDITNFETPNPWKYFFAKVRLKIRTFDMFSQVISANKGDVFKTFSIGGGMDYRESQLDPKKKKRRFKPVSLFKGPVKTDANGKAIVKFDMPNYVGSVRIMVIGARVNSYARSEKTVPVKSELMVLPTLPRVIGPGEEFTVPVSIFTMKDNIGDVDVSIKAEGPLQVSEEQNIAMNFTKADDKDCFFKLIAKQAVGQSKVTIQAKSAKYSAEYVVDLSVRAASPRIYKSTNSSVEAGKSVSIDIPDDGLEGTNRATLSISKYPGIDFNKRLKYLVHYPYGCIEQTTSSVFPQLFIKYFMDYPKAFVSEIDDNINRGLDRLRLFQLHSGAFSYWPYGDEASDWGTLYAGHFMVEAKKLGYHVTPDLYENWLKYMGKQARRGEGNLSSRVYRLYILALAEQPVNSEMNLLKENKLNEMTNMQKWILAASYHLAGLSDKTGSIIANADFTVKDYQEFAGTYGSTLRDKAMILDALVSMGMNNEAEELMREIGQFISNTTWYSTQTIGYSLLGMGKYMADLQKDQGDVNIKGSIMLADGSTIPFDTEKTFTYRFTNNFGKPVQVSYDEGSTLKKAFTTLSWDGVPMHDNVTTEQKNLSLKVKWYNEKGTEIDVSELKQGTTFWGHFHVENTSDLKSVEEIALVQVLPSGWEIENTRLSNESMPDWSEDMNLNYEEYLDIRDDRIMWFFDLHKWNNDNKRNRLDFLVKLNTVTVGEFYLAPTIVEAMYNGMYKASKSGKKVSVVK